MSDGQIQATRVTLIQRLKNRLDDKSWEEFHTWYSPYIMAILNRSGVPNQQVEDLTQDILLSVWKNMETFEYKPQECRFRSWLSRVCRNKVANFFQSKKRKMNEPGEEMPIIPDEAEIDEIIEREWKLYVSAKAFEAVEQRFDEKTMKSYYLTAEGKPTATIAEELDIAESSVYVYNKRVKHALSREIALLRQDLE